MTKKLIEIASEIVQNQVSSTPMSADEIASSLRQVFSTLHELEKAETAGIDIEVTQPAAEETAATKLSPADSIQNDKVICLECGAEMRQLTSKHLVAHGMNKKEYRKKYGFSMRTPLAAKSLTKARSKGAKKRGLPEKLKQYIEARRQAKAKAPTSKAITETVTAKKPKRTRSRKKKA
ncbi:MAG: MucR family transcriptional regulator [Syntrophobacteraceae bacterium]